MVQKGVGLEHLISSKGLEVDKVKIERSSKTSLYVPDYEIYGASSGMLASIRGLYRTLPKSQSH